MADLLGRSVVRRHRPPDSGERRSTGASVAEQLGDAEVEQPGLAAAGHQDVRRLEVTVDHQLAVREATARATCRNRRTRVATPSPCAQLLDRWAARRRIRARGRLTGRGHPGVVEPGDVRMLSAARMSRSRAIRSPRPGRQVRPCGSFSATGRVSTPSARSASHTDPWPPLASNLTRRYGPTAVAPGRHRRTPRGTVSRSRTSAASPGTLPSPSARPGPGGGSTGAERVRAQAPDRRARPPAPPVAGRAPGRGAG